MKPEEASKFDAFAAWTSPVRLSRFAVIFSENGNIM